LNVIGGSTATLVTLGGCRPEDYIEGMPNYCERRVLQEPRVWLGIFVGGYVLSIQCFYTEPHLLNSIFTVLMMMYRVKGAILIGILLTSIISWPRNSNVTFFPHTPVGDDDFNFFKKVVSFQPLSTIGNVIDVGFIFDARDSNLTRES
jgi:AGZA family xanthine/uracil permease-like MFS transporter